MPAMTHEYSCVKNDELGPTPATRQNDDDCDGVRHRLLNKS